MSPETGASCTIRRTVEWPDTDAAGHYHHSTVVRWAEAAEAALLESLGVRDLFGVIPRVRYEVDYTDRLWFGDEVDITIGIGRLGRSSLRYDFEVRRGDAVAAKGSMTAVQIDQATGETVPWPESTRALLDSSDSAQGF